MEFPEIYRTLLLFFAIAGVIIPFFPRMKLSPVLGYLVIGAILGPFGLGNFVDRYPVVQLFTFHHSPDNEAVAEFGVVFLMFTIGLELSWERLRALRRYVFGAGTMQVIICALVIALLGKLVDPTTKTHSLAIIGLALALSTTAIALPILAEQKRLQAPEGRLSFSILLFQDLAVAPILFTVSILSAPDQGNMMNSFYMVMGQATVAIALILFIGRWLLRPLFQSVAILKNEELFMAACLFVVIAASMTTAAFGLSMALGAFLGGLLLAETEYRRAVDVVIEPFKGLLLGLFFTTVGMKINLLSFIENPLRILIAVAGLLLVKGVIITAIAKYFDFTLRDGLKTALMLGPGGEFAFVILGIAPVHLVAAHQANDLTMIVILSMMALPLLARLLRLLDKKVAPGSLSEGMEIKERQPDYGGERVLVVGYSRVGRLMSEMLTRHNIPHMVVDNNPEMVARGRQKGVNIFFGDATKAAILENAGIHNMQALVISMATPGLVETIITVARRTQPRLKIMSRARDAAHAKKLYELGIDDAIPETIEVSLQLSESLLLEMGVPAGVVIASIHQRRDEFRAAIRPKVEVEEDEEELPLPGRARHETGAAH
ncbi:MAG: cation:proton antiporter [Methylobacteriaceae bacterium]|jgi:CPA2 family monovalent cation:H+ antiporter-2|nr:cation:proton antiporter [Methylobacteriaceae bacterium]